ncbi:MAG: c-type cytochrome domain-containing protein [Bacteroidota bacterium]
MRNIYLYLIVIALIAGCKHEIPTPIIADNGGGGGGNGNGAGSGIPCDPDSVYFEQQILPILISNCNQSGCHNAGSASDGVILNNYSNVFNTGGIVPGNPGASDLFEAITETDPDKIMPPPSEAPLTPAQINLIQTWIQQGGKNNYCDQALGPCDTLNVTYNGTVKPILQTKCVGCHSGNSSSGGINLSTWAGVNAVATNGSLTGSIKHLPNYTAMPAGSPKLPDCEIRKIEIWVSQGAPNN